MADRSQESPTHFFKHVLERGPYYEALKLLEANPNLEVRGRVYDSNSHYVHERSTSVELNPEGYLGDNGENEMSIPDKVYDLFTKLADTLGEQIVAWNRKLTAELYGALEERQSDETLIEWMNNGVEWRFDEDGEQVALDDYMPVANLKPGIRDKVLRDYADLFDRTPEEVYSVLMRRGLRFDARGNRVDVTVFKKVDELPEKLKTRVLDKHRSILVEDDELWAVPVADMWKEKLEAMGFERVEIRYSLGYSQGDGASFISDTIDIKKLCSVLMQQQRTEATARALAANLLE
jgi:hypothetical protein